MEIKELSRKTFINNDMKFPVIYRKKDIVAYKFTDTPILDTKYTFELFEYNKKGFPVRRHKSSGNWTKNQVVGFDMEKDFYVKEDVEYALKTTINFGDNREVYDIVYIKI